MLWMKAASTGTDRRGCMPMWSREQVSRMGKKYWGVSGWEARFKQEKAIKEERASLSETARLPGRCIHAGKLLSLPCIISDGFLPGFPLRDPCHQDNVPSGQEMVGVDGGKKTGASAGLRVFFQGRGPDSVHHGGSCQCEAWQWWCDICVLARSRLLTLLDSKC